MYSASFDYLQPKTLKEAIQLLRKTKDAKLLAGGHSLLPAMKLRVSEPAAVIDIGRIKGLDAIKVSKTSIRLGAMATHHAVAASKDIRKRCPVLSETAAMIGDLQVRNRGTVGGSMAHADPAADYPTVLVALGGKVSAAGPSGKRQIPIEKFFRDIFTTALRGSEILTDVSVAPMKTGEGAAYLKHRHPASSYAVVGVAAVVRLDRSKKTIKGVRLVLGGVTPNPITVKTAETSLVGESPSPRAIGAAAETVAAAIEFPLSDVYASGEYRIHLATVMARRALTEAVQRAKRQK